MSIVIRDLMEEENLDRESMASIRGGISAAPNKYSFDFDPDTHTFDFDPDIRPVDPVQPFFNYQRGV